MDVSLPPGLTAAIDALLESVSRKDLAQRAAGLSAAYRGGGTSAGISDPADTLAYLLARLPATYAAVRAALAQTAQSMPNFTPQSLLDAGAGPGAASWAGAETWPGLAHITMLDKSAAFRDIAGRLVASGPAALQAADIVAADIGSAIDHKADLVIASYVLAEFPVGSAGVIAAGLWQAAGQMLLLVEPGTPQGFARIRAARAALIAAGGHVAAPCTHDAACPIPESNSAGSPGWCHFSQRLPRSRDHMLAKGARVPFEDERYSYIAISRLPVLHGERGRLIAPPRKGAAGFSLVQCDAAGLQTKIIARRDKASFARARRLGWGDLF